MKVSTTPLAGILVIEPTSFLDERGFFLELFQTDRYREVGIKDLFVQDNQSRSNKHVLRGMHFQVKRPQAQLMTVLRGEVFDVVVDLRTWSSTFGQWYGIALCDSGVRQIYMPPGFAHGFCVLSDCADLHYRVSEIYDPSDEGGLAWNDPSIGVRWPIAHPILSKRDAAYPYFNQLDPAQFPQPR
jgi:dTDP-4-dehydrorhamnose 3,5-epimerase